MYYLASGLLCFMFAFVLDRILSRILDPKLDRKQPNRTGGTSAPARPRSDFLDALSLLLCVIAWPILLALWLRLWTKNDTLYLHDMRGDE